MTTVFAASGGGQRGDYEGSRLTAHRHANGHPRHINGHGQRPSFPQTRAYTGTRNFAEKSTPGVSATTDSSQYRAGGADRRVA